MPAARRVQLGAQRPASGDTRGGSGGHTEQKQQEAHLLNKRALQPQLVRMHAPAAGAQWVVHERQCAKLGACARGVHGATRLLLHPPKRAAA